MKLQMKKRAAVRKSEALRLRREGQIPAVIYKRGEHGEDVSVSETEFNTHLRHIQSGRLPTTVFNLTDEHGKERPSIVKEIQYNPVNYQVIHLDFEELHKDQHVKVKVPIEFTGVVDCIGVKLGGTLRHVIRHVKVRCLPKDIPACFNVDVRNMALGDSKRLSDLEIPKNVKPIANLKEVAVIIAKR